MPGLGILVRPIDLEVLQLGAPSPVPVPFANYLLLPCPELLIILLLRKLSLELVGFVRRICGDVKVFDDALRNELPLNGSQFFNDRDLLLFALSIFTRWSSPV